MSQKCLIRGKQFSQLLELTRKLRIHLLKKTYNENDQEVDASNQNGLKRKQEKNLIETKHSRIINKISPRFPIQIKSNSSSITVFIHYSC